MFNFIEIGASFFSGNVPKILAQVLLNSVYSTFFDDLSNRSKVQIDFISDLISEMDERSESQVNSLPRALEHSYVLATSMPCCLVLLSSQTIILLIPLKVMKKTQLAFGLKY